MDITLSLQEMPWDLNIQNLDCFPIFKWRLIRKILSIVSTREVLTPGCAVKFRDVMLEFALGADAGIVESLSGWALLVGGDAVGLVEAVEFVWLGWSPGEDLLEGLAVGSTEASEGRGVSEADQLDDSGAGCGEEVLAGGIVADIFTGCRKGWPIDGIRGGHSLEELYVTWAPCFEKPGVEVDLDERDDGCGSVWGPTDELFFSSGLNRVSSFSPVNVGQSRWPNRCITKTKPSAVCTWSPCVTACLSNMWKHTLARYHDLGNSVI